MEENTHLIDSLLERATDYGKTSYELVKLNVIDKTTNSISSFVPNTVVFLILSTVLLFFNLGMALWIGKLVGELFYGFFIVSSFYVLLAFIMYFFLRKWVKRVFYDYMIKQLLG
jgi:Zn-dependent protease with chaperone function